MGIPNKQIGWSQESNLLWNLSKQFERLIGVTNGLSGTSGTSGINGTFGTSGTSGSSGTTGTSGTSGVRGETYKTTSVSTLTIGNDGTMIVGVNLGYSVAQDIVIAYDLANHWHAYVQSYNPSTGELVFSGSHDSVGSGTYSSWNVNLAGASGGDGSSGTSGTSGTSGSSGVDALKDRIVSGTFEMIIDGTGTVTSDGNIVPSNPAYSLGTALLPWAEVYVSPGSIYIADVNPLNLPVKLTNADGYLEVSQGGFKVRSNDDTHETFQLDSTGKLILKSTQPLDVDSPAVLILGNVAGESLPGSNPSMVTVQGLLNYTTRMYLDGVGYDSGLSVSAHAAYIGRQARGTILSPTQSLSGDIVAVFGGNPYSTTSGFGELSSASIKFVSAENQTATARGSRAEIWATPIGTTDDIKVLTVDNTGVTFLDGTKQSTAAIPLTTLTTKGDLVARTSTDVTRLGVGNNNEVLVADSSATTGLAWKNPNTITSPGIFAQTGDSTAVTGTSVETSIVNGGVGTLTIPANGFYIGNSFKANFGGLINAANNQTIRIKVKVGSVVLLDSSVQSLSNAVTNDYWELMINFTIRQVGAAGVASIASSGAFHYTKTNNNTVQGFSLNGINNTTFDTTISQTLDFTVQWGSDDAGNSIYSDIFVLNKIY